MTETVSDGVTYYRQDACIPVDAVREGSVVGVVGNGEAAFTACASLLTMGLSRLILAHPDGAAVLGRLEAIRGEGSTVDLVKTEGEALPDQVLSACGVVLSFSDGRGRTEGEVRRMDDACRRHGVKFIWIAPGTGPHLALFADFGANHLVRDTNHDTQWLSPVPVRSVSEDGIVEMDFPPYMRVPRVEQGQQVRFIGMTALGKGPIAVEPVMQNNRLQLGKFRIINHDPSALRGGVGGGTAVLLPAQERVEHRAIPPVEELPTFLTPSDWSRIDETVDLRWCYEKAEPCDDSRCYRAVAAAVGGGLAAVTALAHRGTFIPPRQGWVLPMDRRKLTALRTVLLVGLGSRGGALLRLLRASGCCENVVAFEPASARPSHRSRHPFVLKPNHVGTSLARLAEAATGDGAGRWCTAHASSFEESWVPWADVDLVIAACPPKACCQVDIARRRHGKRMMTMETTGLVGLVSVFGVQERWDPPEPPYQTCDLCQTYPFNTEQCVRWAVDQVRALRSVVSLVASRRTDTEQPGSIPEIGLDRLYADIVLRAFRPEHALSADAAARRLFRFLFIREPERLSSSFPAEFWETTAYRRRPQPLAEDDPRARDFRRGILAYIGTDPVHPGAADSGPEEKDSLSLEELWFGSDGERLVVREEDLEEKVQLDLVHTFSILRSQTFRINPPTRHEAFVFAREDHRRASIPPMLSASAGVALLLACLPPSPPSPAPCGAFVSIDGITLW